jgi:hypothetical protein
VVVGEFNGDDMADLAVANVTSDTVSVLLGHDDGTFAAAADLRVGRGPRSLAVAHLNGDDKADLAVANATSNTVAVLLGKGDGTFRSTVALPAGGRGVHSLAVDDLNGDGKADLVAANRYSDNVSILLQEPFPMARPNHSENLRNSS